MKPASSLIYLLSPILGVAASWKVPAEYALTPSSDGRYFQDAHGKPFFWQADTAWLLFHRLNYSEAETYLSDRASKGFNVVLSVGFTQAGIDSPNRNGDLTFIDDDVTKPNEPYWAYIDSIVELAWSKGIRVCMVPAWGQYVHDSVNNPSVLNGSTAQPFGKFIGQRYPYLPKTLVADTNPWWENKTAVVDDFNNGGVHPPYKVVNWAPIYDDLANGIVAGEREAIASATSGRNAANIASKWWPLMTIHPTNQWFSGGPIAIASAFLGDRNWLTFDSSQSGHTDFAPHPPIPWWNCRSGWEPMELMWAAGSKPGARKRPAVDNEAHYENRYDNGDPSYPYWNASDVRKGSWQTVFSGGAGLTYGADAVMQFAIPGIYNPDGSGPSNYWETDLKLPGSSQMQWIKKAIQDRGTRAYNAREPAQDVIIGDAGDDDLRITATKDSKGSYIMVYTPTGKPFQIDTKTLSSCGVRASWFDPLAGTYSNFAYKQCGSGGTVKTFTPPVASGHTDWLLVLEVKG